MTALALCGSKQVLSVCSVGNSQGSYSADSNAPERCVAKCRTHPVALHHSSMNVKFSRGMISAVQSSQTN